MTEETFVQHLENLFVKDGFMTRKELGAGYGIADLVLVRVNAEKCKIRFDHNQQQPLLHEDFFRTLKSLPDIEYSPKPIQLEELSLKAQISPTRLKKKIVNELINSGYVREVDSKMYYKVNGWLPIAKEVIAVEAKLHDWRNGILQATRYKSFADKVYLAVPSTTAHLVNREMLRQYNVGLIVMDTNRLIKSYRVSAKREKPIFAHKRNLISEHFWDEIFSTVVA